MKTLKITIFLLVLGFSFNPAKAQFNPGDDINAMITAGFGTSFGSGLPIFGRAEFGINDYISLGGQLSYQSYSYGFFGSTWRINLIGINARANYHFNEIFDLADNWDVYGGASLGYYIANSTLNGSDIFLDDEPNEGGFGVVIQIGARYFFQDNLAVNFEVGGGNIASVGSLGLTVTF